MVDFLQEFDRSRQRVYLTAWECSSPGVCFPDPVPVPASWFLMPELSKCHAQGFARLPNAPEWVAFTSTTMAGEVGVPFATGCPDPVPSSVSAGLGSFLYLVKLESKSGSGSGAFGTNRILSSYPQLAPRSDATRSVLQLNVNAAGITGGEYLYHPGGFQAIGDYLLVGTDDRGNFGSSKDSVVWLVDVSDPHAPFIEPGATLRDPNVGAETVGIVRLEDGTYLMVKGSNSSRLIKWYRSTTQSLTDPGWYLMMTWDLQNSNTLWIGNHGYAFYSAWDNYQAINLYREEGTDEVFLVGTFNDGIGGVIGGENYGIAWRLVCDGGGSISSGCQFYGLWEDGHNFGDGDDAYNFAAGAGFYVHPGRGTLHMYAIEHTTENCGDIEDLTSCYFRFGEMW